MTESTEETLVGSGAGETSGGAVTVTPGPGSPGRIPLEPGAIVGRYVVVSRIGAGGMGVVLAAYDPELDRKVALKVLKPRAGAVEADHVRLQREAQALAKLTHPNVVAVHDVGVHAGSVFVAMEFVEGQTLGAWREERTRSWREVIDVLAMAGEGLAAAHEAGLVHRDFKPDNVMIDRQGRARVMDFGLARADEDAATEVQRGVAPGDDSLSPDTDALGTRLTQTGALLGTPAYMSAEQFLQAQVDEKSDQFSFCVTAWEALLGARPFAGETVAALCLNVTRGRIQEPSHAGDVPLWIRRALRRGMSVDPADRWPTLRALLNELARDPVARRRRAFMAGGLALVIAGSAWGLGRAQEAPAPVCADMERHLDGVWDEARRAAARESVLATGVSFAPDTWPRVERVLDGYTADWVEARAEACAATQIRGEQSAELMDRRMGCLDRRLDAVRGLVDVLSEADRTVVTRAVRAAVGLPSLAACADAEALLAEVPPPEDPAMRERVAAHERSLARAGALRRAGKYPESLELAREVLGEADGLGYEPLLARTLLVEAQALSSKAEHEDAARQATAAYGLAARLGMTGLAARAAASLVHTLGYKLSRHDEADAWAVTSDALSQRAGTVEARAAHLNSVGLVAQAKGKYAEARAHHEAVLQLRREASDEDTPEIGIALNNIGIARESAADYPAARKAHEEALAIWEKTLGKQHPNVANSHNNLGVVAKREGRYEDAEAHYRKAMAIFEITHGPEHPHVGATLHNLANIAYQRDDHALALKENERARAIFEKALGADHPSVASSLANMSVVASTAGRQREALGYATRAVEIREAKLAPDHPSLALPLAGIGRARFELGEPAAAIDPLQRAVELAAKHELDPVDRAEYEFLLARALWETPRRAGGDRKRARELARTAEERYVAAGESSAEELARVRKWLAGH